MNRWRKYIVCLLLVTQPVSLWAAVAVPGDCASAQNTSISTNTPAATETEAQNDIHAHHNMAAAPTGEPEPDISSGMHHSSSPQSTEPCCDTCLSACLANGFSALSLSVAVLESTAPETHFQLLQSAHFLPGPSYPSLYRPPISQI